MAEYRVLSPLPGTFYRKPQPDADNYANEGDRVTTGSVIGLVEVMKQFSELTAGQDGRLLTFCVADAAPVEPGQLIAVIETDG